MAKRLHGLRAFYNRWFNMNEVAIEPKTELGKMATDQTPNWLGAAVTGTVALVTGIWALLRYMFVTRREMELYIREAEERFEKKIDEVKQTLISLHKDNKDARHRLRNDLNHPMTTLAANFEALRQELVRQRQSDAAIRANQAAEQRRLEGEIVAIKRKQGL